MPGEWVPYQNLLVPTIYCCVRPGGESEPFLTLVPGAGDVIVKQSVYPSMDALKEAAQRLGLDLVLVGRDSERDLQGFFDGYRMLVKRLDSSEVEQMQWSVVAAGEAFLGLLCWRVQPMVAGAVSSH